MYKDDPAPKLSEWEIPNEKSSFRTTMIELLSHTGTHVDAPSHLLKDGKTIDQLAISSLTGDTTVIDVSTEKKMTIEYFKGKKYPIKDKIVLLKTGEGATLEKGQFRNDYLAPDREFARFLVTNRVKAVGIDTLSIDRGTIVNEEVHAVFLEAGMPVIEGLNLDGIEPGNYFFACLPLKIRGIDGSPARAILIKF